jgi:hypothetical protein
VSQLIDKDTISTTVSRLHRGLGPNDSIYVACRSEISPLISGLKVTNQLISSTTLEPSPNRWAATCEAYCTFRISGYLPYNDISTFNRTIWIQVPTGRTTPDGIRQGAIYTVVANAALPLYVSGPKSSTQQLIRSVSQEGRILGSHNHYDHEPSHVYLVRESISLSWLANICKGP